jgi:type IV secretory pathway protease TraF
MIRTMTIGAIVIGAAMGASTTMGMRWNMTPSMPMGLWAVQPIQGPVERDEVVTLCLEPAAAALGRARGYLTGGECPGDVELLIVDGCLNPRESGARYLTA